MNRHQASRRHALLQIEPLDPRRLLASSLSGTTLTIRGSDAADDIRLDVDPVYINLLRVRINGTVDGRFLLGDYTTIDVRAARGNDRIEIGDLSAAGHPKYLIVDAGDGNDNVIGSPYADRLSGGKGNDSIRGNGGNDTLHGDDGNDTLKGDAGDDQVNGDDGDDQLSDNGGGKNLLKGGDGRDRLVFEAAGALASIGHGFGGAGDDELTSAFSDFDYGNGTGTGLGSAELYGDAGNDRLTGWYVHGGDGDDRLTNGVTSWTYPSFNAWGDAGDDTIDGTTAGGYGATVYGGSGNDWITGRTNMDGGSGNDRLLLTDGDAARYVMGGPGNDQIRGTKADEQLDGGDGNDTIRGGDGNDILHGNAGADELRGEGGYDDLYGDSGDDRLYGGTRKPKNDDEEKDGLALAPSMSPGDRAFGGKGSDWVDPSCVWAYVEQDSKDVKTGATGAPGYNYGGGSTSGSVTVGHGGVVASPGVPLNEDVWYSTFGQSAIFVGASDSTPTTAQLNAATDVPSLAAADRKAVKASLVHVPRGWTLTRTADTDAGLAWYRITRSSAAFALMQHDVKLAASWSGGGFSTRPEIGAATMVGIHPRSLILLDEPSDNVDASKWLAPSGWNTRAIVTKPGVKALLPSSNAPLTFGQPASSLPDMPTGSRAIYTLSGLVVIDKDGARLVP